MKKTITRDFALTLASQKPSTIVGGWAIVSKNFDTFAWVVTGNLCVIGFGCNERESFALSSDELAGVYSTAMEAD